jgi:transposase
MQGKRRKFTREFKIGILREYESGKSLAEICRENDILPSMVSKWKKEYSAYPDTAFKGNGNLYKDQARIAELERKIGQLYLENEFLKKVMEASKKRIEEKRKRQELTGGLK